MNGASKTLEAIGFLDYLKSDTQPWKNLHQAILAEKDPAKQAPLRQAALHADWYLGSVHALTETGEMLIASNTGSQLPHLAFTSKNALLVVSAKKIVSDMNAAFQRLSEVVIPLEDARIMGQHGVHTTHAKTLLLHKENPHLGRQVHVVLVDEAIGF